jgi:hypothetical protein
MSETKTRLNPAALDDLYDALANLVPRFERCCAASGTSPEFVAEATKMHRTALSKANPPEK